MRMSSTLGARWINGLTSQSKMRVTYRQDQETCYCNQIRDLLIIRRLLQGLIFEEREFVPGTHFVARLGNLHGWMLDQVFWKQNTFRRKVPSLKILFSLHYRSWKKVQIYLKLHLVSKYLFVYLDFISFLFACILFSLIFSDCNLFPKELKVLFYGVSSKLIPSRRSRLLYGGLDGVESTT